MKCHEVGTCTKLMELYTPWSNAAEGTIHELMHGASRKMAKSSCPSKLWDLCLKLEAYNQLHATLNNYELQGKVPETIVSRETADISPFLEQ